MRSLLEKYMLDDKEIKDFTMWAFGFFHDGLSMEFLNAWNSLHGEKLTLNSKGKIEDDFRKMIKLWKEEKVMEWINVKDRLPTKFEVVWIYWRDREVLLGCRTHDEPNTDPSEGWYSFEDEKCRWTHWWMRVADSLNEPHFPEEQ